MNNIDSKWHIKNSSDNNLENVSDNVDGEIEGSGGVDMSDGGELGVDVDDGGSGGSGGEGRAEGRESGGDNQRRKKKNEATNDFHFGVDETRPSGGGNHDDDDVAFADSSTTTDGRTRGKFFNSIQGYTLTLCLAVFGQTVLTTGYIASIYSTIEKKFGFSSKGSGVVASCYEVSYLCSILIVSFMGSSRSRPKWIAACAIIVATAAVVFASPHFFASLIASATSSSTQQAASLTVHSIDRTTTRENVAFAFSSPFPPSPSPSNEEFIAASQICRSFNASTRLGRLSPRRSAKEATTSSPVDESTTRGKEDCEGKLILEEKLNRNIFLYVFCLGNALLGVGATAFHTLGLSYLHDNSPPESAAFYLSIYFATGGAGPMIGFLLAALFLSFSENISGAAGSGIGAWWPGLFIGAIIEIIAAVLMLKFPDKLTNCAGLTRCETNRLRGKNKSEGVMSNSRYNSINSPSITNNNNNNNNDGINNNNDGGHCDRQSDLAMAATRLVTSETVEDAAALESEAAEKQQQQQRQHKQSPLRVDERHHRRSKSHGEWKTAACSRDALAAFEALPRCRSVLEGISKGKWLEAQRISQHGNLLTANKSKTSAVLSMVAGWITAVLAVIKRPRWILLSIYNLMDCYASVLLLVFGPKYIETLFAINAADAPALIGGIICPAAAAGILFAGVVTKICKLSVVGQTYFVLGFACVSCLAISALMAVRCPSFSMSGFNFYKENGVGGGHFEQTSLWFPCNANCSCDAVYAPVCGADGETYFNPCFAGCRNVRREDKSKVASNDGEEANWSNKNNGKMPGYLPSDPDLFFPGGVGDGSSADSKSSDDGASEIRFVNCACVHERSSPAKSGRCRDSSCGRQVPFLGLMAVAFFAACCCASPTLDLILGAVDEQVKSIALGIQNASQRLLAFIPTPIIFGHVLDAHCLVWRQRCDGARHCLHYDRERLPYITFGFTTGVKAAGIFCLVVCVYLNHLHARKRRRRGTR